jgi:hypothetical protein
MGNLESQPLELVQDIFWHCGGALFDACTCNNELACDQVQVLLPKLTLGLKKSPTNLFEGSLKGAVLFGRSDRVSKWWPRNPKLGPKETEAVCIAEDNLSRPPKIEGGVFHDSGLGSKETRSVENSSTSKSKDLESRSDDAYPPGLLRKKLT